MAAAVAQLVLPAAGPAGPCSQRARLQPFCSVARLRPALQSGRRVAGGRPVGRGSMQIVAARVENEEVAVGTKAPDFEVSLVQATGLQALIQLPLLPCHRCRHRHVCRYRLLTHQQQPIAPLPLV
jgi:hypothetical protein